MEKASKNFINELKKQKRTSKSLLFLDNVKIIRDALSNGCIEAKYILTSLDEDGFNALGIDVAQIENEHNNSKKEIKPAKVKVFKVDQRTIEMLADTKTPQQVLCIAYLTQDVVSVPTTNFLVLDNLQDPGNVGTLIRTAKASGFEYVFLIESVRKNNSKLIRSSVGAVFDNKVFEMSRNEFIQFAKENKLQLICCDMNGKNIFKFAEENNLQKQKGQIGIVIGNEGQGVSAELSSLCVQTVKIPMRQGIESLNAGVSGSIIMYEINKNKFD